MAKKLKIWNGRGHGKYDRGNINVAAYSQKQAAELISKACETRVSVSEISVYYSNCWGNSMEGIIPTEPCVYVVKSYYNETPERVL